jgi:hypothetical protein
VVVALLLDFPLGSGLLPILPGEDLVQRAALRHQWLRGSGYGRPSRRSGESPVDWVDWGYDYVMFKLFNSYIRQNLPPAGNHINSTQQTSTHHHNKHKQLHYCKGGTAWGNARSRTTRPGLCLRARLKQKRLGGTLLGRRRLFYSRGVPSSGTGSVSNPCSPSSGFPSVKGCAAASLSTAAAELSGFSRGACVFPKSGPHPMTGVPSKTWSSPIAGTGVPLWVHSCIRRSRACLRLSWPTASLLTAAAALASAWAARICCSLTVSSARSARWVCSLRRLACSSKSWSKVAR